MSIQHRTSRTVAGLLSTSLLLLGTSASAGGWPYPVAQAPYHLPAFIQAENFNSGGEGISYHDTDSANLGSGNHRPGEGVDLDDVNGVKSVSWTRAGEWLDYTIEVDEIATYTHTFRARVASSGPGGTFHIEADGVTVASGLQIPDTGGWQTWTELTASFPLPPGEYDLRIHFDTVGSTGFVGNVDSFELERDDSAIQFPYPLPNQPPVLPYNGIPAVRFDSGGEDVAYHDTDAVNEGGGYRTEGVDIIPSTDSGAGYVVGSIRNGEWLEYTVYASQTRTYSLALRLAATGGGAVRVDVDGATQGTGSLGPTGGPLNFVNFFFNSISLTQGQHVIRVSFGANGDTFGSFSSLRFQ